MDAEKRIIDQISGWLTLYDDGTVDRTWTGPPEIEFLTKPVAAHDEFRNGISVRDVKIDTKTGLAVRLYIPERKPSDEDDKLPVILHFHGGGFCFSEPEWFMYYQFYTRLVRSTGAICVSVKTRLAPEHRLPAAIDDGRAVFLWLHAIACGEYSSEPCLGSYADFRRMFLVGDSSGGNLVHQVAAWAGTQEDLGPEIAGCVILHPGFVRSKRSRSELENASYSDFLTLDMVDKFLDMAVPIGSTKDHPFTCPMGSAAPPLSGLKLPPVMVGVAEKDLMHDTQVEYCEAMKKAGKDIVMLISPGVGHSFYLNKMAVDMDPHVGKQSDHLLMAITDFIRKH
ncbi:probable carboxylesterase 17 [Macadamia integrifolia]|uniref:probable carboxylesterase 17 n=1 Tax=Macadamia integrifolia TaxID=60698 RepID=UPI001C4F9358|nr:probable carboxylesterase 17 [Macadamia integrifolia]